MEILGNLVHPLKSILVTGKLPDSVGDEDDKLPAHQPGLSVLCTQMKEGEGGKKEKLHKTQGKILWSHATEQPMAGRLLHERMLQFPMRLQSAALLYWLTVWSQAALPVSGLLVDARGSLYSHPHSISCFQIL